MENLTKAQREELKRENEEKKEYLLSYKKYKQQEKRLEEQLEEIRTRKMFPSSIQSDAPSGNNQKDLSDYIVKCDELIEKIIKNRYKAIECFEEVQRQIEGMEKEDEKNVLMYRYIKDCTWEEICTKMKYSWRQVHRIHGKALSNFEIKKDGIERHA